MAALRGGSTNESGFCQRRRRIARWMRLSSARRMPRERSATRNARKKLTPMFERAGRRDAGQRTTRTPRSGRAEAERADRRGELAGRQRDVADVERQARRTRRSAAPARASGRARCWTRSRRCCGASRPPSAGLGPRRAGRRCAGSRRSRCRAGADEPVLDPAGDQRAGEQQHAGERGVERGRAEQRQRFEHVVGRRPRRPAARRDGAGIHCSRQHQRDHGERRCRRCRPPASGSGARPRRRSPPPRRRWRRRRASRPSPAPSSPAAWSRP